MIRTGCLKLIVSRLWQLLCLCWGSFGLQYNIVGNELAINNELRGILDLSYDPAITDTTKIESYCAEIERKGWTVTLSAADINETDIASESSINTVSDDIKTVKPFYAKPIKSSSEMMASYIDENGEYWDIKGGEMIFGDDLSTYGMFTSIEDAAANMRLTKINKEEKILKMKKQISSLNLNNLNIK